MFPSNSQICYVEINTTGIYCSKPPTKKNTSQTQTADVSARSEFQPCQFSPIPCPCFPTMLWHSMGALGQTCTLERPLSSIACLAHTTYDKMILLAQNSITSGWKNSCYPPVISQNQQKEGEHPPCWMLVLFTCNVAKYYLPGKMMPYIYTVKKNGASLLLLDHKHRLGEWWVGSHDPLFFFIMLLLCNTVDFCL